jgi:hypothetical protein
VKRVQDAMVASERREHTEFSSSSSSEQNKSTEGIELQELGKRKAAQPKE